MAKRLKIHDKQGNVVPYDISSASITIDAEGKTLDVKLSELVTAIAGAIKSITFNGNSPTIDDSGNVNLGYQLQANWNESNQNYPSFIQGKPNLASVATSGDYNDLRNKPTIPEGVQTDSQMSDSSDAPVKNRVIKAYVDGLISGLVDGAPQALDTLNELAAALGDNSNFAATITQQLAGKISGIQTHDGQTLTPQNGIVTLPEQTEVDLDDYYNKGEVDGLVENAGKVKSVTINGQKKLPNEQTGDVDLDTILQGPQGPQGPQGDSGYTGAANELRVANTLDDDDPTAAISAACAHDLKVQAFVEQGTFGEAYSKATENNVVFPWFLDDVDSQGNTIKKMIWHIGNNRFVDAIGAEIVGDNSNVPGIKITAAKNGIVRFYKDDGTANTYKSVPVSMGDNIIAFEDLLVDANDSIDTDNPSRLKVAFYDAEDSAVDNSVVTKIDFDGLRLTTSSIFGQNLFANNTTIEEVRGLVLDDAYRAFMGASKLRVLEVSGGSASSPLDTSNLVNNCSKLEELYAKDLYGSADLGIYAGGRDAAVMYVDIRNIAFSIEGKDVFQGWGDGGITTLILGAGVDLEKEASSWFYAGASSITNLVYMNNNSNVPILSINGVNVSFLNNKVGTIYVPSALKNAYVNTWLQVTTPIKGYTIVDGEIVFEE